MSRNQTLQRGGNGALSRRAPRETRLRTIFWTAKRAACLILRSTGPIFRTCPGLDWRRLAWLVLDFQNVNFEMKVRCHQVRNERGRHGARDVRASTAFTLVEVMVAIFVLAVAMISLYAGFTSGFMLVDSAREELRASQILTQKAEAIRLCTWSSLTNCPISFSETYDAPSSGSSAGGGTLFVGTVTTNAASSIPDTCAYKTNMCMATITLYWTNNYGKQTVVHTRTLKTLVARYGIQNYIWGTTP